MRAEPGYPPGRRGCWEAVKAGTFQLRIAQERPPKPPLCPHNETEQQNNKECRPWSQIVTQQPQSFWTKSQAPRKAGGLVGTARGGNPAGADDGNRTRVASLGSWNSTIELHPQTTILLSLKNQKKSMGKRGFFQKNSKKGEIPFHRPPVYGIGWGKKGGCWG